MVAGELSFHFQWRAAGFRRNVLAKTVVAALVESLVVNCGKNVMLQRTVVVMSEGRTVNESTFVAIIFAQFVQVAPLVHWVGFVPTCRMNELPDL